MKLAVVGYGKMGREVEAVARERAHEPVVVRRGSAFPASVPVGIDFTRADAVLANTRAAMKAKARYVIGTTGWDAQRDELARVVAAAEGGVVHAANFSLGVNLFYKVVREAAALFARFPDYDPYVLERHHRQKKDAPSGTARALARILEEAGGPRPHAATALEGPLADDRFHVAALRAGGIVGEHTVGFDSGGDEILLEHRARTRRGFALGAVLAAEWVADRTGLYGFEDVVDDLARRRPAT
ncbi:MAG: 4-hydroxy-tetrahydrodipicolinate reductase [Acidobacteria bacterium]|nr:MAG: 4-hydroxy-tetrahydrodipicolinate reductase [Acidobacteriota bacterium]